MGGSGDLQKPGFLAAFSREIAGTTSTKAATMRITRGALFGHAPPKRPGSDFFARILEELEAEEFFTKVIMDFGRDAQPPGGFSEAFAAVIRMKTHHGQARDITESRDHG